MFPLVFKQRFTTVKWYLDTSHDGAGPFSRKSQRREQPWTEQTHSLPALLQRLETGRLFVRLGPGFCENQDRRGSCRRGFPLISGSDRHVVSADLGTRRVLITSGGLHVTENDTVVWGSQATQGEPVMIIAGEEIKFLWPLNNPEEKILYLPGM